ncbi:hemerythrin domain-containing protein [Amycolatopsis cihanbeyliensis]|uniref:Hemerythrin HHE cation binding domain-containing protein n=1 Tax=Amycolatopsis cihanbeyliensis TaxID=1128664 RepID=A0A542DLH3_AMYCI|nr:hemerythrin domain-containing protein [Amycolatopsis cihanbeyliensis]TQJ03874.1 hemerythrin HHE cation binding domain-containing protein [Amycolatopsis cihanbeyliensis]
MSDVVELILADHRRFEQLLQGLRESGTDHAALRAELATLLVAHAEAEEDEVYPKLRREASTDHDVEHGEEEHAEINQALLAFLELTELAGDTYEGILDKLTEVVDHHTEEEEETLLKDATRNLAETERERLGVAFVASRKAQLDADCGRPENVRLLVQQTAGRLG